MANELREGNEAYIDEDYTTALQCYTSAIASNSTNSEYFVKRAICLFSMDRWDESVADCDAAIALDSSCHRAYLRKGMALLSLGDTKNARIAFEMGERLDPSSEKSVWQGWICKCSDGDDDPVSATSGLSEQPKSLGVSTNWTFAYNTEFSDVTGFTESIATSNMSRPKRRPSIEDFISLWGEKTEAEKVEKSNREKEMGNDAISNHNYQEAIRHYTRAIVLVPTNSVLHTNRATAYFKMHLFQVKL
jgi:tetratricopeptide (TPR) repeat protein